MHSNRYTIMFALLICVTCSVILALTAGSLRPVIQRNEELDSQRNILKALGFETGRLRTDELEKLYAERIRGFSVDASGGPLPVFARIDNGDIGGYCIPVSGKGLWSTLYGYLAIQRDGETIMGLSFYKHGETPGLGGEVEKKWFTDNFVGKKIFDADGVLTSITIVKGAIPKDAGATARIHMVDGISGATMTGNSVNVFLKKELKRYEPFFQAIRRGKTPAIPGV